MTVSTFGASAPVRAALAMVTLLALVAGMTAAVAHDDPLESPLVAEGFVVHPWAAVPAPTALDWGPDGRLYVVSLSGQVWAVTPGPGGAAGAPVPFAQLSGSSTGLAADPDEPGVIYASEFYDQSGETWGRVVRLTGLGDREVMLDGLPGGQHWVNDLAVHPVDGLLYVTNGNRTDSGIDGTANVPETDRPDYPWRAGGLLRIDRDARGLTPNDEGVEVVAEGMRNLYDVAFWPPDPSMAYIPINGSQDPASDDVLYATNVADGTLDDMGFPSCLISPHERDGLVSEAVSAITGEGGHHDHGDSLKPAQNPDDRVIEQFGPCDPDAVVWPVASFGGHPSANGLAFAHGSEFPGTYGNDLFVAQWGSLEVAHPTGGHDVVRVNFRDDGSIVRDHHGAPMVEPFLQGVAPLDVVFGPDGAMYVADNAAGILRVAWHGIGATAPEDEACPGDDDHGDVHAHHDGDDHGDHGDHGDPVDPWCAADGDDDPAEPGKGNGKGKGGGQDKDKPGNGKGKGGDTGGEEPCVEDSHDGHDGHGHHDHGETVMHHPEPCPDADGMLLAPEPHHPERQRTRVFWDPTGQFSPWEINYEAPKYEEDDCGTEAGGVGVQELDPTKDCTMTHGSSFREGDPEEYFKGHGEHAECRVTVEEYRAAFALAERTRQVVGSTYDNNLAQALRDGYMPFPVPGTKAFHMFNWDHYDDYDEEGNQNLFDPERPEMFTYAMTDEGLMVVNVVYAYTGTTEELPDDRRDEWWDMLPRPYGCMLEWHAHSDEVEGPATGNFDGRAWMTHVWTYPRANGHTWQYGDETYEGVYPFGEYGDGTEAHAWFLPYRWIPALCNKDGGCI